METVSSGYGLMIPGFKQAVDRLFERLGRAAVYRVKDSAVGDTTLPVKIIVKAPDRIVDFGDAQIHTPTHVMEVRVKDIANPKAGDDITLDDRIYRVQGAPRQDSHHLIWILEILQPKAVP